MRLETAGCGQDAAVLSVVHQVIGGGEASVNDGGDAEGHAFHDYQAESFIFRG